MLEFFGVYARTARIVSMPLHIHHVWLSVCFVAILNENIKCGTSSPGIFACGVSN
jgi:hypothetical protein